MKVKPVNNKKIPRRENENKNDDGMTFASITKEDKKRREEIC